LEELRSGHWVSDHKETGYTGTKGRPKSASTYFATSAGIVGELEFRLERAGIDGLMLEVLYGFEFADMRHVANCLNVEERAIQKRAETALAYVSGWHRKKQSYKSYCYNSRRYKLMKGGKTNAEK
jgi:hypothetical protein